MTEAPANERSFDKVRRKMVSARIEFLGHLAKFGREELQIQPEENTWSPLEVAYHLYLTEGLVLEQMRRVQEEDHPLVTGVSNAQPHIAPNGAALSLENVLASLAARREETFEYLADLPEEAWLRPLRHEDWGELKFYQMANLLALHDKTHSGQLVEIRAKIPLSASS